MPQANRVASQLTAEQIRKFLPHAGAMCLLDNVQHYDAQVLTAELSLQVNSEHPLVSSSMVTLDHQPRLHAVHVVEYAAQAAGLHIALQAVDASATPASGVIAMLKKITTNQEFLCGSVGVSVYELTVQLLLSQAGSWIYQFAVSEPGALPADVVMSGRFTVVAGSV